MSETIEKISDNYKLTQNKIKEIIDYILKYKYIKVIHFQDFKELFTTIQEKFEINLIEKFKEKRRDIFENSI